jgi:hypothetical protein
MRCGQVEMLHIAGVRRLQSRESFQQFAPIAHFLLGAAQKSRYLRKRHSPSSRVGQEKQVRPIPKLARVNYRGWARHGSSCLPSILPFCAWCLGIVFTPPIIPPRAVGRGLLNLSVRQRRVRKLVRIVALRKSFVTQGRPWIHSALSQLARKDDRQLREPSGSS